MKRGIILLIAILIFGGIVYTQRHALEAMMLPSSTQTVMHPTPTAFPLSGVSSDNIYLAKTDAIKGKYLTDFAGMTLYTFDKDMPGVSSCSGKCLTVWTVYTSGATAQKIFPANITVITRADGTKQFAWKGMPLYYYATDAKVGDMLGDGTAGAWHIVKL